MINEKETKYLGRRVTEKASDRNIKMKSGVSITSRTGEDAEIEEALQRMMNLKIITRKTKIIVYRTVI